MVCRMTGNSIVLLLGFNTDVCLYIYYGQVRSKQVGAHRIEIQYEPGRVHDRLFVCSVV